MNRKEQRQINRMTAPPETWRYDTAEPKATCIAKGVQHGPAGKGFPLVGASVVGSRFYGVSNGPTHTFDADRFAFLKGRLGETGFPKTAREAMALCFTVRRDAGQAAPQ